MILVATAPISSCRRCAQPPRASGLIGQPLLGDLFVLPDGEQGLDLTVPLPGRPRGVTSASCCSRVAPDKVLYPMLQTWPTPSDSAEILLVERRGEPHRLPERPAASGWCRPVPQSGSRHCHPAGHLRRARRNDRTMDARTIAAWRVSTPPRSRYRAPWGLVAKIDEREVLLPLHERIGLMIFVSVFLVIYRQRHHRTLANSANWSQRQRQRDQEARQIAEKHGTADRGADVSARSAVGNATWRLRSSGGRRRPTASSAFTRRNSRRRRRSFFDRIHPDDRAGIRQFLVECDQSRRALHG